MKIKGNPPFMALCYINYFIFSGCKKVRRFFTAKGNSGMGTIEIIIIIAVLVALALLFKNFIMDLASDVFAKIRDKADTAINGL